MKRLIPHLIWISGLLVLFVGFACCGGPPYQDPTPEMLARELSQERTFETLSSVGLSLIVVGVIWIVARRILTKKPYEKTA